MGSIRLIDSILCLSVVSFCGRLARLAGVRQYGGRPQICDIETPASRTGPATRTAHPCLPQSTNRIELASANTRMSRILQAWIISSALSASVVATRQDEVDDENNEAVVPNQFAPHPQRPMQFVTTDEVMNRFGDNARFEGLRGSSSSPPSLLSSSLPQHYIINGQTAAAGRYTWFAQAYTKVNGGFYLGGCGAVLIAKEWIATAAHCVDGAIQPTHFEVGTYCPPPYSFENCEQEREFGKVKRRYLHEEWGISIDGGPINDIALFQLEDPIESVEPIKMDTGTMDLSHGSDLKAIGIGVTNQMTGERASVLQEVGMRYVSKEQCKVLFRGAFRESHMICAFEENKGTCSGDSGGPLFTDSENPVLVGITSFGAVKCAGPFPDVYTSIVGMIDWMRDQVCEESEDPPSWCSPDADAVLSISQVEAPDKNCSDDMDATYLHNPLSNKPQKTCQWLVNKDAARREKVCQEKPNAAVVCKDTCEGRCQPQ